MCLTAFVACQQGQKSSDLTVMKERDSLNRVIAQKDNEINDMMSTMNDIEEGFRAISAAENRVSVARQGEGASMKERIAENMKFIRETMEQNRELINKLRNQLRQSTINGDQLRRTLENLQQQLEEKDSQLKQLAAELEAKNLMITELNTKVEDLSANVDSLKEDTKQKAETIQSQDKQLHTAWFIYGTRRELKDKGILERRKRLSNEFLNEHFTKIDIRVDKEIKFYSRRAELLTSHPESSYVLEPDANDQYVLRITDPQRFWSNTRHLIVLVK